jgi:hypothetical protein
MLGKENFAKPPLPGMQKAKTPILLEILQKISVREWIAGFPFSQLSNTCLRYPNRGCVTFEGLTMETHIQAALHDCLSRLI